MYGFSIFAVLLAACSNSPTTAERGPGPDEDVPLDTDEDGVPDVEDCAPEDPDSWEQGTWYTDEDGDGFGDAELPLTACEQPPQSVENDMDCDDLNPLVNPDAIEVCNGFDDDCDGDVDVEDSSLDPASLGAWYSDADGDGYGDPEALLEACEQPDASVENNGDCDDTNPNISPASPDGWYDGVDQNCDGWDDWDQDGDGEIPYAYGGTDCDDTDAAVNESDDTCRADCTAPSTSELQTYDPPAGMDIQFDADCVAYVGSSNYGTDWVHAMAWDADTGTTTTTIHTGYSNWDMGSVAVDPSGTGYFVGSMSNGYSAWTGGSTSSFARDSGGYVYSDNGWYNSTHATSPSSIAWDSSGCVWAPNYKENGSISCLDSTTGTETYLATLTGYAEAVALDADDLLYVSTGMEIFHIDKTSGATTLWYTMTAPVLDMAFDITGEAYVLTNDGEIYLIDRTGSSESSFESPGVQGKLAISPDGFLYLQESNPPDADTLSTSYTAWEL